MTASAAAERSAVARQVEVAVSGMTCAACAARVERKLNRVDGLEASVNYATGRAVVTAPSAVTDAMIVETVEGAGYGAQVAAPWPVVEESLRADPAGLWRRLVVSVLLFVPVADLSITSTGERSRARVHAVGRAAAAHPAHRADQLDLGSGDAGADRRRGRGVPVGCAGAAAPR